MLSCSRTFLSMPFILAALPFHPRLFPVAALHPPSLPPTTQNVRKRMRKEGQNKHAIAVGASELQKCTRKCMLQMHVWRVRVGKRHPPPPPLRHGKKKAEAHPTNSSERTFMPSDSFTRASIRSGGRRQGKDRRQPRASVSALTSSALRYANAGHAAVTKLWP